jgi:putative N6-adenine-specific DNA methylase
LEPAPTRDFFLTVTPGLEELARRELRLKMKLSGQVCPEARKVRGGLELSAPWLTGLSLNALLKIPTRVLLRTGAFKATDFTELFKRSRQIEWQQYFRQGEVGLKVSSHGSRLKIKTRIESTVSEALEEKRKRSPFRKAFLPLPQTLVVRVQDDRVELSVDTSGEALYKRGRNKHIGPAPVRETLGAALYLLLLSKDQREPEVLIDPMAGSGTLALEAMDFFRINRQREYSFQNFPCFQGFSNENLRTELRPDALRTWVNDRDPKAVEMLRHNFSGGKTLGHAISGKDLAELSFAEVAGQDLALVANPPYNARIKADLKDISRRLEQLFEEARLNRMALIWPRSHWTLRPLAGHEKEVVETTNGGIEVGLVLYSK